MTSFFQELKRRNVYRVGLAYLAVAWLVLQVADVVLGNIDAPSWVIQVLMLLLAIGFPIALILAWAFELTPDGLRRDAGTTRGKETGHVPGRTLDRAIVGVIGAAVVILLVDRFALEGDTTTSSQPVSSQKSVAVLPFVAMSTGEDDEFFADGLTEEILNSLAQLPELLVTSRTSAFAFKGLNTSISDIADQLGVEHVVEGSVRRSGNQMRITAQLIRASDQFHVWSDTYDRIDENAFEAQTEIAEKIAAALDVVLDDASRDRMRSVGIRDPEAFVQMQKGIALANAAHESGGETGAAIDLLTEARAHFERTIALEPRHARAFANLADYYVHKALESEIDSDGSSDEAAAFRRLVRENYESATTFAADEGQRLDAQLNLVFFEEDWRRMPALLDAAMNITDCIPLGNWSVVAVLINSRATQELAERQIRCDPLQPYSYGLATSAYLLSGQFEAAVQASRRGLERGSWGQLWSAVFKTHLASGRFDEAGQIIDRYVDDAQTRLGQRSRLAAVSGNRDQAFETYAQMRDRFSTTPFGWHVHLLALLGRREEANQLAAEIDSMAFGLIFLASNVVGCACGAPFDLEYTQNFARLVEEAGIEWPPPSPVVSPLKDW